MDNGETEYGAQDGAVYNSVPLEAAVIAAAAAHKEGIGYAFFGELVSGKGLSDTNPYIFSSKELNASASIMLSFAATELVVSAATTALATRVAFRAAQMETNTSTKLLGTARDNLLNAVENPKLRNIVNDLYRTGAKVGSGSSMDAFRLEQLTGVPVGGKPHAIKLFNYRPGLQRLWSNRANLSAGDRQITKQLLGDIQNALSGY